MLVTTSTMDVVGPSNTFGEMYTVVSDSARPFREPGIDIAEPVPVEAPAGVPRFDGNFERVMLDSDDLVDAAGVRRPRLESSRRHARRTRSGAQYLRAAGLLVRQLSCRARHVCRRVGRSFACFRSGSRWQRVHHRVAESGELPRRHCRTSRIGKLKRRR